MKTQKELGAVHLLIEGLDKERFKKLVEGHDVVGERRVSDELKDTCVGVEYDFIENSFLTGKYRWVSTDSVDENSRLITLDELEKLLEVKQERTAEVIQAEIKELQRELEELNKIKAGDVILTKCGKIGIASYVDKRYNHIVTLSHSIYSDCAKIDPNKTVKEVLGLD